MSLESLKLPFYVTTSEHNPVTDFFDPVLERAQQYDIAVGYFSSAWLRDAAHGMASFALNGGKARWVISPELSVEDLKSLQVDGQLSDERVQDFISQSYEDLYEHLKQHTREALGWLLHDGVLNFKVGIPKNRLSGIMHAKQGIFTDELERGSLVALPMQVGGAPVAVGIVTRSGAELTASAAALVDALRAAVADRPST